MSKKQVIWIAAGMFVCVGVGAGLEQLRQFFKPIPEEALLEEVSVKPERVVMKDEQAEYEAELLRKENDELRRALLAAQQKPAAAVALAPEVTVVAEEAAPRRGNRGRQPQIEFTEEQREEMQARRDEFNQRREQVALDRMDFLASLNTKAMTPAQRETHEKLVASVARMNELTASLTADFGAEGSAELRDELRTLGQDLAVLYEEERNFLLQSALGTAKAEEAQRIYENTSMIPRGMFGGGGPGGGGMGGFFGGGRGGRVGGR